MAPVTLAWAIGSWALCEIASTKLPHYILPALPALALLAAMWWEQAEDADAPIGGWRAFGLVLPVLLFAAAIGVVALIAWQEGLRIWLVDQLLASRPQIASRIAYLGKLLPWQVDCLLGAVALLLMTATAGFLVARRGGVRRGLLVQTCGWVPAMLILVIAMTRVSPFNESLSRQAARQAVAMGGNETHYFAIGYTEPAVFFYLPADRYARVDKSALTELADIDVPFVLIAGRNLEADIRAFFSPRIDRTEVVSGLNTAKGSPGTACVFRIIPNTRDTKDLNSP